MTSGGSAEYHDGVDPALNWLAKALAEAGLANAVITEDGTAVSRTERMESGGRSFASEVATLFKLDRAAESVGIEVTPAMEASSERSEVACLLTASAETAATERRRAARVLVYMIALASG